MRSPKGAPQIPPLRYPGFPVELGGVGALHAPFPYRKAHTRPCPVQRGRKSGYAPVGMTKGRVALPFRFDDADVETAGPDLRFFCGFSFAEIGCVSERNLQGTTL